MSPSNAWYRQLFVRTGIHFHWMQYVLAVIPIAASLLLYLHAAHLRRADNPRDKMMPLPADFVVAVEASCTPDEFSGEIPLWEDLKSSLRLYAMGFAAAVVFALLVGLPVGGWSWANAMFDPMFKFMSYLPPIALLPLIMLSLGIGDMAKCSLIFLAVAIPLTRSLILRIQSIHEHRIWNALTLGPGHFKLLWFVIRRIVEPGFLEDTRLLIGTAWVYLITAELIASSSGLGYRINVASRNLNIAQVLFYIVVVCMIAFLMDKAILFFNRWKNRWAFGS